ncbi:hypothetical protein NDI85_08880 [Halomicroarcula sp. S1AR25-4]|uniref:hypothetical protein n=1 Tax=Haloarcula sp. S1AR25-4 TaxID=2950538 RepID=UPI0028766AF7|nr:hypothetical protein [Halomicroarcula sp. S1AR25-4]MDS0277909.1 hypothetical protein [Halomicroarcula sp. S1AR25-4]
MEDDEEEIIIEETAEILFQQQFEIYQHIQTQAVNLLRTVIAAGAFLMVAVGTILPSSPTKVISQYNSTAAYQSASQELGTDITNVLFFALSSRVSGFTILAAGGLIGIVGLINVAKVLRSKPFDPVSNDTLYHILPEEWNSGHVDEQKIRPNPRYFESKIDQEWLNKNNDKISTAQALLSTGQKVLVASGGVLFFGLVLMGMSYLGDIRGLIMANFTIVATTLLILLMYSWAIIVGRDRQSLSSLLPDIWDLNDGNVMLLAIAALFVILGIIFNFIGVFFWIISVDFYPLVQI